MWKMIDRQHDYYCSGLGSAGSGDSDFGEEDSGHDYDNFTCDCDGENKYQYDDEWRIYDDGDVSVAGLDEAGDCGLGDRDTWS